MIIQNKKCMLEDGGGEYHLTPPILITPTTTSLNNKSPAPRPSHT